MGKNTPVDESRWIMLDVETSGLNMQKDSLLAIAAIAMRVDWKAKSLTIDIGDSFEVVLQQEQSSSKENILLHGIGTQKQRDGVDPKVALLAFNKFVGSSPLLAFHAAFDETMIKRHQRQYLNSEISNSWLDEIGRILDFGFRQKKQMAQNISNTMLEEIYDAAIQGGATGGKISGAGGGGFMFFYCPGNTRYKVIKALENFKGYFLNYQFTTVGANSWRAGK